MPEPMSPEWIRAHMDEKIWYSVEAKKGAKGKKAADVYVFEEISMWGVSAQRFTNDIKDLDVDEITVHINSPGGSYFDGVAIMNALKHHKASIVVRVDALAASAASVIAMAGDEIVMSQGSQMMIHEARGIAYGTAAEIKKASERVTKINADMAAMYAERAGGNVEDWAEAMSVETWYNASEAVAAGLADRLDENVPEETTAASLARFDLTVFAHAGRDDAPDPYTPPGAPAADHPNKEEGKDMPVNKSLVNVATALGVKDADKLADDAAVEKAIADHQAAEAKAVADAAAEALKTDDSKDDPKPVKVPGLPEGAVVVDSATLQALVASGKRADKVITEMQDEKRDRALDQAVLDGKFPAASKPHWATNWDKDPEGTKAQIDGMPKGLIPTGPIGNGVDDADAETSAEYRALYPEGV